MAAMRFVIVKLHASSDYGRESRIGPKVNGRSYF